MRLPFLAIAGTVVACGGSPSAPPPAVAVKVAISPDTPTIEALDGTIQLRAVALGANGDTIQDASFEWSSAAPSVVSVSSTGLTRGEAVGMADITASTGAAGASTTVTVVQIPASVTVSPGDTTIAEGDTAAFSALVQDARGNDIPGAPVVWVSADSAVATADEGGQVAGVGFGQTTIVASSGVASGSRTVRVVIRFAQIAVGENVCGVSPVGNTYCWGGRNDFGELGVGDFDPHPTPTRVLGPARLATLSVGGGHVCGLTSGGAGFCWGSNVYGELGTGTGGFREPTQQAVAGGVSFASIAAWENHTCGGTGGGLVYCWGQGSATGAAGTIPMPTPVVGASGLRGVTSGYQHSCALDDAGAAWCWGFNGSGQLGDSSTTTSLQPVPVVGGLSFALLDAGVFHTCGLTAGGAAYCWGANLGNLGNDSMDQRTYPVPAAAPVPFVTLSAGNDYTCATGTDQATYCWGIGVSLVPAQVSGGTRFTRIGVASLACGIATDELAYCWRALDLPELVADQR